MDFWCSSKKLSDGNLITYPFIKNLQSSLPGAVVVKYTSSKRQEYNLVINVVFYCYFLENKFSSNVLKTYIIPFASRLTAAGLRSVKKVA